MAKKWIKRPDNGATKRGCRYVGLGFNAYLCKLLGLIQFCGLLGLSVVSLDRNTRARSWQTD